MMSDQGKKTCIFRKIDIGKIWHPQNLAPQKNFGRGLGTAYLSRPPIFWSGVNILVTAKYSRLSGVKILVTVKCSPLSSVKILVTVNYSPLSEF